jgi:hypothetical protein
MKKIRKKRPSAGDEHRAMAVAKISIQVQLLRDYEIAKALDNKISVSFLRKDRATRQLFPYHRVGRSCLYQLDEVLAALEAMRVGGKKG